jgi:hypothetical protein
VRHGELGLSQADFGEDLAEELLGSLVLERNHLANDLLVGSPVLGFIGFTTGLDHRLNFVLCLFACCGPYELQQFEEVLAVNHTVVVLLYLVKFLRSELVNDLFDVDLVTVAVTLRNEVI